MSKFWICAVETKQDFNELELLVLVDSEENLDGTNANLDGSKKYFAIPDGYDISNVKLEEVVDGYGEFVLVEDTTKTDNPLWQTLKNMRNVKLSASDWTDLPHASLSEEEKTAWVEYRQDLRDIPQDFDTVDDVIWPIEPV